MKELWGHRPVDTRSHKHYFLNVASSKKKQQVDFSFETCGCSAVQQPFQQGLSWVLTPCGSAPQASSGRRSHSGHSEGGKEGAHGNHASWPKGIWTGPTMPPQVTSCLHFLERKAWIGAGSHLDRPMHLESAGESFCQGNMRCSMTIRWLSQRERLTSTSRDAFSFPSLMVYVQERQFLSSWCQRQGKKRSIYLNVVALR